MTEQNHDSNINESTINESPEDKKASDEAAADAQAPTEDLESAPDADRLSAEKLAETARKVATETAYAAAGFAGLVGEKAKAFYEEQRKQYADAHPEEDAPKAKAFLDQLSEQLNKFAEDLTRSYKDMAERGRDVVQGTASKAKREQADGTEADSASSSSANDDGSSGGDDSAPLSGDLADDLSEKTRGDNDPLIDPPKQDGIL